MIPEAKAMSRYTNKTPKTTEFKNENDVRVRIRYHFSPSYLSYRYLELIVPLPSIDDVIENGVLSKSEMQDDPDLSKMQLIRSPMGTPSFLHLPFFLIQS